VEMVTELIDNSEKEDGGAETGEWSGEWSGQGAGEWSDNGAGEWSDNGADLDGPSTLITGCAHNEPWLVTDKARPPISPPEKAPLRPRLDPDTDGDGVILAEGSQVSAPCSDDSIVQPPNAAAANGALQSGAEMDESPSAVVTVHNEQLLIEATDEGSRSGDIRNKQTLYDAGGESSCGDDGEWTVCTDTKELFSTFGFRGEDAPRARATKNENDGNNTSLTSMNHDRDQTSARSPVLHMIGSSPAAPIKEIASKTRDSEGGGEEPWSHAQTNAERVAMVTAYVGDREKKCHDLGESDPSAAPHGGGGEGVPHQVTRPAGAIGSDQRILPKDKIERFKCAERYPGSCGEIDVQETAHEHGSQWSVCTESKIFFDAHALKSGTSTGPRKAAAAGGGGGHGIHFDDAAPRVSSPRDGSSPNPQAGSQGHVAAAPRFEDDNGPAPSQNVVDDDLNRLRTNTTGGGPPPTQIFKSLGATFTLFGDEELSHPDSPLTSESGLSSAPTQIHGE